MDTSNRIQFDAPRIDHLARHDTVVDLHFHSHYSDGLNSIPKIAEKARSMGIGIAITDHNDIRGAVEIAPYDDLLVIPGIEITTAEGPHLLAYFYDLAPLVHFYTHHVQPHMGSGVMSSLDLPIEDIIMRARAYPSVIILAHPYSAAYTGVCNLQFSQHRLDHLYEMVDGVEAINATNLNKWNLKCTILGFNLDGAMVGGSDGHSLGHMGQAVTVAPGRLDRHGFLDAIKNKRNRVVGKEINLLRKMTTNGMKIRSNFYNYPDLFEKNLKYGRAAIHHNSQRIRDNVRRRMQGRSIPQRLRDYLGG